MRDDAVLRRALPLGRGLGRRYQGCKRDFEARDRDFYSFQSETRPRPSQISPRPRRDRDLSKVRLETETSSLRSIQTLSYSDRPIVTHNYRYYFTQHWMMNSMQLLLCFKH